MQNKKITFQRITVSVIFIITINILSAREVDSPGFIKNLNTPSLGITSSSVILLWEDIYEPDILDDNYSRSIWTYDIYQDSVKIGTTNKHNYTVKELLPEHIYKFSVCLTKNTANRFLKENSITVSTKKAGKVFNVRKFGASGDGKKNDTEAVQKTINMCEKGGTVKIPAGSYLVGHLELKSDMTLELEKGALITFLGFNEIGTLPETNAKLPGLDGEINHRSRSLITGLDVHNVIITGEGTIDGNGETWWPNFPNGTDRVNGVGRPFTLQFVLSSDILIQGITVQDSPMFNNVLFYVDNCIYSDVKFLKYSTVPGRNGDALDPYSSRNILIIGCVFGNQDDSIAIKGHGKQYRFGENISIMDCIFDGNAAPGAHPLGFACGSGCKVRNVRVKNCVFIDAASIANIKTNRTAIYTFVDDVSIENITYTNTKHKDEIWNRAPVSLDQYYYGPEGSNPSLKQPVTPETPFFRNIRFRNIKINNPAGRGIYMAGFAELPIQQISFDNMIISSKDGLSIQNVEDLSMQNVKVLPNN
jgi:exo-poly-alpha-galacturonosidase